MRPMDRARRAAPAVALILTGWASPAGAATLVPAPPRPLQESPAVRQLRGVKRVRHFLDKTDSEIVLRIASEAGLRPRVDATLPARRVVLQKNLTDWDFLEQLAQRNGFRVWVDEREGTLNFRRAAAAAPRR